VALVVFLAAAGCGEDDGGSTPPDAAPIADASGPDAPVPSCSWYVMDSVQVPETANEANMMGLDLDGDEVPDNVFGGLLAALHGQADVSIAGAPMEAVVSGRALTLVGLEGQGVPEEGPLAVRIAPGADLDDEPGDNFSGAEPFALDPLEGVDGDLPGSLADGRLRAGPATVPVLLAIAGAPAEVATLHGVGGRIDCRVSAGGLADGGSAPPSRRSSRAPSPTRTWTCSTPTATTTRTWTA
jgi:hypothetical protein